MTIFKGRPWPWANPFVSLWLLFWPNCCHNHLICPPQREENCHNILHISSRGQVFPLSPPPLALSLPWALRESTTLSSPVPFTFQIPHILFSLSFSSVMCRIPICFSGDTNWKIAPGFPWAATPTGSLLISGNLRRLLERLVTGRLCLSSSVPFSQMTSSQPLERGGPELWYLMDQQHFVEFEDSTRL